MLRIRVLSSLVAIILLISVIILGREAFTIAIFAAAFIAMTEYFSSIYNAGYKPIKQIGYLSCIFIGVLVLLNSMGLISISKFNMLSLFLIYIVIFILFCVVVINNKKHSILDISLTLTGILYVPFLFSFLVLTRNLDGGLFYIWIIFIGAWATDTLAYFTGTFFGKTKLLPSISPKKTVEGSIGGIMGCTLITLLYGLFLNNKGFVDNIHIYHFLILGTINGIVSQIGDLAASAIKRFTNIKDFGNIMPGHGGVLDRFDSILFIAPMVYFYVSLFI